MSNWDETEEAYVRTVLRSGRRPNDAARLPEVEHLLIKHLAPAIPERVAIDIGGFRGAYTKVLRQCGFEVFTFEPVPSLVAQLRAKWRHDPGVHIERIALSDQDGMVDINLAAWQLGEGGDFNDDDAFNTLQTNSGNNALAFMSRLSVVRRRLAGLVESGLVPPRIGVLKIDAEGHDPLILEGAWPFLGRVTLCEYWSRDFVFSNGASVNDLSNYDNFFASRTDVHRLVIGRDIYERSLYFQVDPRSTEPNSWGNILFTKDAQLFASAVEWCFDLMGSEACRA